MNKENEKKREDVMEEHLPEWIQLFRELRDEADSAYPDGRVRIIVPRRKPRKQ